MTAITKVTPASISTPVPPTNCSQSGLLAGEAITGGDACYIKSSDGKIYRASGLGLTAPAAPALSTASSGGTVLAGDYAVKITYINAAGETVASETSHIITSGSTSTLTVTSPAAAGSGGNAATKFKAYITPANGGAFFLQNGAGTNIGSNFTLTAPPVTNTANPPSNNTTGTGGGVVDGFAAGDAVAGDPLTIFWGVNFRYGTGLTPGSFVYLDDATPGALNDSPTEIGTVPIGRVIDATRIWVKKSY
jgi:hypothetical protein